MTKFIKKISGVPKGQLM